MIKMWAKVMVKDKIISQYVYESIDNFSETDFFKHIEKICHHLDIPTPIILPVHIKNFYEFNNIVFRSNDFVESIDFDKLTLENAITR